MRIIYEIKYGRFSLRFCLILFCSLVWLPGRVLYSNITLYLVSRVSCLVRHLLSLFQRKRVTQTSMKESRLIVFDLARHAIERQREHKTFSFSSAPLHVNCILLHVVVFVMLSYHDFLPRISSLVYVRDGQEPWMYVTSHLYVPSSSTLTALRLRSAIPWVVMLEASRVTRPTAFVDKYPMAVWKVSEYK